MATPPSHKRQKAPTVYPSSTAAPHFTSQPYPTQPLYGWTGTENPMTSVPYPAAAAAPSNPRKRRASQSPGHEANQAPTATNPEPVQPPAPPPPAAPAEPPTKKKPRTNTPWTPAEEQTLKVMRDAGNSWSEIAKAFPARTEGSVKKHWYKDMHYAEFAEDESAALLEAIKEYDANKWKVIGQKLGKPAKACEQYAKEHFK